MKETVKTGELVRFLGFVDGYLKSFPKERSQLTFALQVKFADKYKKWLADYNTKISEKRAELQAEHCIKVKDTNAFDEKEVVVGNQIVFQKQFTKEGDKKFKEAFDKFMSELEEETVSDFKPYKVDLPKDIHITWVEEFEGYLFEPLDEEAKLNWYLAQKKKEEKPE